MNDRHTIRLLVVDDENDFCNAIKETLVDTTDVRCEVVTATTVKSAREALINSSAPFDLFLIDQRLMGEELDGIQLIPELLQASPGSAVIVLTAYASREDEIRALQAGADYYIPKTSDWRSLFEELILRIQVLVENKQARRRRLEELEGLVKIHNDIMEIESEEDLADVLNSIVQLAMRVLPGVDAITLFYFDRETNEPKLGGVAGVWNVEAVRSTLPDLRRVLPLGGPYYACNASTDPYVRGGFVEREKIRSTAVFPLRSGDERVGFMFFNYRQPQAFDESQKNESITLFAQQAALALHKALLYDENKRRRQRLETVARITPIVCATLDPEEVVRAILTEILKIVPRARQACMLYYDQKTQDLRFSPVSFEFYHIDVPEQRGRTRVRADEHSIATRVARTGHAANVPNVNADLDYLSVVSTTRSELCVPIKIGGDVLGVLVLESDRVGAFTEEDQLLLQALADQAAVALKKAQEHSELVRTQDELAANSAIAWMGLFGSNWSHTVNQRTFEIEGKVFLIRQVLSPPPPRVARWLDEIEEANHQLKSLPITEKILPEPKPGEYTVQLDRVLKERIPGWCKKYQNVKLVLDLNCGDTHVPIEEGWLEIPLEKLVSNATKAMSGKGVLTVRSARCGDRVEVQVQDTGKGIPEEAKEYLLKRPVPKPTAREGSGLGLLIARKVLMAHGGDLMLLPTVPNEGTTFMFYLPVAETRSKGE